MLLSRKRTWRTILAFPVGLSLGWLAAGYAQNQAAIQAAQDQARQGADVSEQPGDHGVGDEEAAAGEAEVVAPGDGGALEHAD